MNIPIKQNNVSSSHNPNLLHTTYQLMNYSQIIAKKQQFKVKKEKGRKLMENFEGFSDGILPSSLCLLIDLLLPQIVR